MTSLRYGAGGVEAGERLSSSGRAKAEYLLDHEGEIGSLEARRRLLQGAAPGETLSARPHASPKSSQFVLTDSYQHSISRTLHLQTDWNKTGTWSLYSADVGAGRRTTGAGIKN